MFSRTLSLAISTVALIAQPHAAHAKEDYLPPEELAKRLSDVGTWTFEARRKGPDGKPECVETWFFAEDGTGWVQSGEQRVIRKWRTARGESTDRWLYITSISSTTGEDCMGRPSDPAQYPRPESGFTLLFFQDFKGAYTCQPAQPVLDKEGKPTGQRYLSDNACWGQIKPAPPETPAG